MPFTGSHPAAVVPLLGTPLVPSALVIGSMLPDLVYYVPLSDVTRWRLTELSHTMPGIVWFDLLLGLFAFLVWHALIVPLAVAVSPGAVRERLGPDLPVPLRRHLSSPKNALLVVASLFIGTETHVLWDELTHADRWGARHIAWLDEQHGLLPGYRWGQYASSVLGLVVIGWALWRWWTRADPRPGSQRIAPARPVVSAWVWGIVLACAAVGAAVGVGAVLTDSLGTDSAAYVIATYAGGAGLFAVLVCAVVMLPRRRDL